MVLRATLSGKAVTLSSYTSGSLSYMFGDGSLGLNTASIGLLQEQSQIFVNVNPADTDTVNLLSTTTLLMDSYYDFRNHMLVLKFFKTFGFC